MEQTDSNPGRLSDLSPERRMLMERLRATHGRDETKGPTPLPHRDGHCRLSYGQAEMWLAAQLAGDATPSAAPICLTLTGALDVPALRRAMAMLIHRHEVLRTVFEMVGGEPKQLVRPMWEPDFAVIDLSGEPDEALRQEVQAEMRQGIDLGRGPILRTRIYRMDEQRHVLLIVRHHIAFDGRSDEVLLNDLGQLYRAEREGVTAALPELPVQYADYAQWELDQLTGANLDALQRYWQQALANPPARLQLPFDHPRPAQRRSRGRFLAYALEPGLGDRVIALAQAERATPFMLLLAILRVVLWRHTGQRDVLIGTPTSGRHRAELEQLIGFFLNMLVLRGDLRGDPSARELLARERSAVLGAFDHQEMPYSLLSRSFGRTVATPLFQVTFSYHGGQAPWRTLADLSITPFEVELTPAGAYDFEVQVERHGSDMILNLAYNDEVFDETTIVALANSYADCLSAVLADPDQPVSRLAAAAGVLTGRASAHLAAFRPAADGWLTPEGQLLPGVKLTVVDDLGLPVADGAVGQLRAADPAIAAQYAEICVRCMPDGSLQLHTPLPAAVSAQGQPGPSPSGPIQTVVAGLWRELLEVEVSGVGVSLFEVGGHSLTVAQLAVAIEETFGVSVAVADLFEAPTIAGQSALLEQMIVSQLADVDAAYFDQIAAEASRTV